MQSQPGSEARLAILESEFEQVVRQCSHGDLARCVRLLGTYLALYKSRHGELPAEAFAALHDAEFDRVSGVLQRGLREAGAMLELLQGESVAPVATASIGPQRLQ